MQNTSENQTKQCRNFQRFHQIHAGPIRFPPKSIHNPSESQQYLCKIHQNFKKNLSESQQNHRESNKNSSRIHQNPNNIYAEPIRTSTKNNQNLNKTCAESIRTSTKFIRISKKPIHNTIPQPGNSVQTTFRLRRTAARFRLLVLLSMASYSHSAAVCIHANQQTHFHRRAGPPAPR